MTVSQKTESSAQAIYASVSSGPPTTLSSRSLSPKHCDFCKRGHTEKYCWREYPEKSPASLPQISVDNTSSKIVEEIRDIIYENEKKLPSIVQGKVVKKKKKGWRKAISIWWAILRLRFSMFKTYEETREKDSKGSFDLSQRICCLSQGKAQVLVDEGAALSSIKENLAQKPPLA